MRTKFREFTLMLNEESCRQLYNACVIAEDKMRKDGATKDDFVYIGETASKLYKAALQEGWKI